MNKLQFLNTIINLFKKYGYTITIYDVEQIREEVLNNVEFEIPIFYFNNKQYQSKFNFDLLYVRIFIEKNDIFYIRFYDLMIRSDKIGINKSSKIIKIKDISNIEKNIKLQLKTYNNLLLKLKKKTIINRLKKMKEIFE